MMNVLPLIAEFLGTFLFVMSILVTGNAIVIGATLALIVWLLSKISGGHVNPAVTLAFFLKGSMSSNEFVGYLGSQLLGGVASVYTYKMFI
jgi:glycerol uptake facilitator-like aquaporin